MIEKSVEIYYDIADIPGLTDRSDFSSEALTFRNKAMHHIEAAITDAGVGEWSGAEIGTGEVNFGFLVEDFERAEAVIREAVAGTDFSSIREIRNMEIDAEEFADMEHAPVPLKFRFLMILLPILLLPFMLVSMLVRGASRLISR